MPNFKEEHLVQRSLRYLMRKDEREIRNRNRTKTETGDVQTIIDHKLKVEGYKFLIKWHGYDE